MKTTQDAWISVEVERKDKQENNFAASDKTDADSKRQTPQAKRHMVLAQRSFHHCSQSV